MKIKRLEICGFKSFADKVVLDFQQGVTGVVGPNGCGKSNVVDAIRWCMGEQSAKNLRGKAMEDVIFAGSETRKPLGMAEVTLVFSTEDGRAPAKYLEFSEIQLTRRLYRDGDSDYLINKTPCRLLDITELFMDTGVGTRAYSIIEQGKIGMVLHARPEERRFLIEEAAGVTKFKSRKQLALKKIEATRQNLVRLSDVLGEIRRQLGVLQRQARKAEKFREYRDELREIELLFSAVEYKDVLEQRRQAEGALAALNERLRSVFATSTVAETRLEQLRLELAEAERQLGSAQEDIYRLKGESGAVESALEFQRKELDALTGRMARFESEIGELELRLKEAVEQRDALEIRREASAAEVHARREELQLEESALLGHQQAEEELGRMLEARRRELFAGLSEAAQFKNRFETAQKRLTALADRVERSAREGIQLAERYELVGRRIKELDVDLGREQADSEELKAEISALRGREDALRTQLAGLEKSWQSRRDELTRAASRLHSLQELETQFAGYGQGVRTLMRSAELGARFTGVLADAVEVPVELEAAFEAVLADRLQSVACSCTEDVLAALDFLKKGNAGRAGLALPCEGAQAHVPDIAGAKPLAGLVKVSGPHAALILRMLAPVMLTSSLAASIELSRRYPELCFVTTEGDIVAYGGLVSGGSSEPVQKGIIHKKREIRELEQLAERLGQDVQQLEGERDGVRKELQEAADSLKALSADMHQGELKLAGLRKDRQQAVDELKRLEERISLQSMERETLEEERAGLEAELKICGEKSAECAAASKELEESVNRLKGELEERRQSLAVARERVTLIRVQVATLTEQHESCQRSIADIEKQQGDLTRRIGNDREQLEKSVKEREQLQEAIVAGAEKMETIVRQHVVAEQRLAEVRSAHDAAQERLAGCEEAARQARDAKDEVRQTQAELNLKFSTLSLQAESLERGILERSRISMPEALQRLERSDFDEEARRQRKVELQRLLDEMGEVNLMAIEECAEMEQRFEFLSAQKDDLEESMRSLQQAIQKINRTTRQRFQETYNQVNVKFQEVFPRLFCGGQAELRLTNEEDLLETGIDIIVQPPGKKLQNVTLLSGGEKALTAVALIFSIFLIKPTPFCLLDEVDAPLDDANIGRFNEMVREMSSVSQFIVITHNKTTMQVADMLYGITMETPGASKVVSVRLH